ncbi:MAG: sensor domain-containing diguanylate cyclase [Nitrospirota bacterium]
MGVLKQNNRLSDIIGTARTVVSQLDLDKAFAVVLKKAMEITKTRAGSIALYDAKTVTMRIRAHRGFSKQFIASREWKVRRGGLTDRILKARGVTIITDATNKSFFTNPVAVCEGIKSLICVPLIHIHEVVGILYVDDFRPRKFTPNQIETIELLASFASIAIHNARTHHRVKQQAITDSLTGLFNRRCFEDILSRELPRADRHRRELSLALVDVDDFKKYNDAYGHQAGDEALAALGEAIRKTIRSTDLAARYGGDEIVIILPETKLVKAYNLFADRIKRGIEEEFARISDRNHPLTVTIGIASFPRDGKNSKELVLAADKALLAAKKDKHSRRIGCSRRVRVAGITPLPFRTAPGAGSGPL